MDENEGIKAIVFLQGIAGAEESENQARKGWRRLSDAERRHTMRVYSMLKDRVIDDSSAGESDA